MSTIPRQAGGRRAPRRWRRAAPLLTLLALISAAAVVAGCGSAAAQDPGVATLVDPSASPDASASPSLSPEDAMEAFAKCMRDHGIDLQVVSADGNGPSTNQSGSERKPVNVNGTDQDKAKFEEAQKACAPLLPKGGVNGRGQPMDPEMQDKLLAFSRCMREHGIDMPDPVFSDGGATVQLGGPGQDGPKIDPTSQAFKDAQKACEDLLPGKGGMIQSTGGGETQPGEAQP